MTVIAGLVTEGGVVLGADRMLSSCSHKSDSGPKIFEREGWAYAITGSVRTIQIMEKVSKDKKVVSRSDVIDLAASLYEQLKEKGLGGAKAGEMPDFDSAFLVATIEGLFHIQRDFGVAEYKNFHASGIGCEYALGVLHDGYSRTDPVELVCRAIAAANALNPHCGGGPDVVAIARTESETKQFVGKIMKERGDGARK
jgi:20S proteasome alpha/beta subunit